MRLSLPCLVAAVLAGGVHAQAASDPTQPARTTLRLGVSDAALDRPYGRTSAVETAIQPRTEVDHRFGRDGPVAQAGYLCGIGGVGPDSAAPGGGPASLWNHQGTFLGASLGYGFR
ncbi:MAG TPA: hypothetical protein VIC25_08235 [Caulobacteraceae bacterium]